MWAKRRLFSLKIVYSDNSFMAGFSTVEITNVISSKTTVENYQFFK